MKKSGRRSSGLNINTNAINNDTKRHKMIVKGRENRSPNRLRESPNPSTRRESLIEGPTTTNTSPLSLAVSPYRRSASLIELPSPEQPSSPRSPRRFIPPSLNLNTINAHLDKKYKSSPQNKESKAFSSQRTGTDRESKSPSRFLKFNHRSVLDFVELLKKRPSERNYEEVMKIGSLIQEVKFFQEAQMTRADSYMIARIIQYKYVPAGKNIFEYGSYGDKFYIILEGTVGILPRIMVDVKRPDGSTVKVAQFIERLTLTKGEGFGELALITNKKRSATITAKTNCHFATIDKANYNDILQSKDEQRLVLGAQFFLSLPYFKKCNRRQMLVMHFIFVKKEYQKGQYLYDYDDECESIYLVKSGEFEMTINAEKYLENKYQFRITQNHYNRQVEKVQKYDYMKNLFSKDTSKLMTKNLRLRDKKYRESFDNQKVKLFKSAILGVGQMFGVDDVIFQRDRTSSVRCKSLSAEIYYCKVEEFTRWVKPLPLSWNVIVGEVEQRAIRICKQIGQTANQQALMAKLEFARTKRIAHENYLDQKEEYGEYGEWGEYGGREIKSPSEESMGCVIEGEAEEILGPPSPKESSKFVVESKIREGGGERWNHTGSPREISRDISRVGSRGQRGSPRSIVSPRRTPLGRMGVGGESVLGEAEHLEESEINISNSNNNINNKNTNSNNNMNIGPPDNNLSQCNYSQQNTQRIPLVSEREAQRPAVIMEEEGRQRINMFGGTVLFPPPKVQIPTINYSSKYKSLEVLNRVTRTTHSHTTRLIPQLLFSRDGPQPLSESRNKGVTSVSNVSNVNSVNSINFSRSEVLGDLRGQLRGSKGNMSNWGNSKYSRKKVPHHLMQTARLQNSIQNSRRSCPLEGREDAQALPVPLITPTQPIASHIQPPQISHRMGKSMSAHGGLHPQFQNHCTSDHSMFHTLDQTKNLSLGGVFPDYPLPAFSSPMPAKRMICKVKLKQKKDILTNKHFLPSKNAFWKEDPILLDSTAHAKKVRYMEQACAVTMLSPLRTTNKNPYM